MISTTKAILAGIAANFLAMPIDAVMHTTGFFPPAAEDMSDAKYAVALAYRTALAVLGGYVTAHVSPPPKRMSNAKLLGAVGIVMSSAGAYAMWDVGHNWYPLALVVISYPSSSWGGQLYTQHPR